MVARKRRQQQRRARTRPGRTPAAATRKRHPSATSSRQTSRRSSDWNSGRTRQPPAVAALLNGLSRGRLAAQAGLHRSYLGKVLRGERNLSFHAGRRVAQALQISLDELYDKLERVRAAA